MMDARLEIRKNGKEKLSENGTPMYCIHIDDEGVNLEDNIFLVCLWPLLMTVR